jgi:hypothetical protein
MHTFCIRRLVIMLTAIFFSDFTVGLAQQVCSPLPPDEIAVMSDQLKQALIQKLHLQAYKTGDLNEKITCYDQILNLNPTDTLAKSEIDKAQQQLKEQIDAAQKDEAKQSVLQAANNALSSGDETALKKALNDLDQQIKTNAADKDLADLRQRIQARLDERKTGQQVRDAIKNGHDAYFAEDSVQLVPALSALDDALKVDPTNIELKSWKQKVEGRIRTERFLWWLKVILLTTAIVGVIAVGLYLLLRKRQGLLEFADGNRMGEIFPLDKPATKIGALSDDNDLVVSDRKGKVSRYHCEIVREGRRYFIKDGSTNGTWVNQECLEAGRPKLLRKGDRLSLAGEVNLIFRLK